MIISRIIGYIVISLISGLIGGKLLLNSTMWQILITFSFLCGCVIIEQGIQNSQDKKGEKP
jgi:hypothetical protein